VHLPFNLVHAMREKISKRTVDALPRGASLADTEIKGFTARRLASGTVTYGLRYRDKTTRTPRWLALGLHGNITPDEARTLAKKHAGSVADRRDPAAELERQRAKAKSAASETVAALLDGFLERHVRPTLRSAKAIERALAVYVRPRLGDRSIYSLRRGDITALLDAVEDQAGPVMADRVLAYVRKAFNWHSSRDEDFLPPIVRGMTRTRSKDRARERVLSDAEICDLWRDLDQAKLPASYPRVIRAPLLTGQRRNEVARADWREIDGAVWTIPAARYKTKVEHVVPLSPAVIALLGERKAAGFVFSTDGGLHPLGGLGRAKRALDLEIAESRKARGLPPMPHWTLHDLRRTARSLMSRAGVRPDVSERVIGHAIAGVAGVYDRHSYADEKREALEKLAALVERIVNPTPNVVRLERVTAG
jgi:integrase